MPGEFDPAEELGLFPDRIFVCNCRGFITKNNYLRDLCARFIRNGAHFFDVLVRYDELTAYVLGREEATAGNFVKWVVPFLKANGATDHLIDRFGMEDMQLMPGATTAVRYIASQMPSFINTSLYEHGMMRVSEQLDTPLCESFCTKMEVDNVQFSRAESRKLREMAETISALRIPKVEYELNVPMEVDAADVKIIRTMDDIIQEQIPGLNAMSLMESVVPVTSHKKAYQLLDIRRQTNIDLDSTFYIGSDNTDFQSLDLVRDAGGVSVAFNGTDFAVRGSTIAILSKDSTVGAVFAEHGPGPQLGQEVPEGGRVPGQEPGRRHAGRAPEEAPRGVHRRQEERGRDRREERRVQEEDPRSLMTRQTGSSCQNGSFR